MTNQRARVALVLGNDVLDAAKKDDVIARLIATGWNSRDREQWYRLWCGAVGVFCSSVDLYRVKKGRRRKLQCPLDFTRGT